MSMIAIKKPQAQKRAPKRNACQLRGSSGEAVIFLKWRPFLFCAGGHVGAGHSTSAAAGPSSRRFAVP
ncbi:hypothetical protein ACCZ63_21235, partial [Candidatus Pantoea formicae]